MIRNMVRWFAYFGLATLGPAAVLAAAAVWGGLWIVLAVLCLTALVSVLDRILPGPVATTPFAGTDVLPLLIAAAHLALLPLVVWSLSGAALSPLEKLGLFFAAGLWFGQISNANAHELIHQTDRLRHRLGMWCYITLLFGHHTSAHVLIHHRFVASPLDPNTARKGEGLYRYVLRAWAGSFVQGYNAEAARLSRLGRPAYKNPYGVYVGGAAICVALAAMTGGWGAVLAYVGLCLHAQVQLLMSDYVQHYGLVRQKDATGRLEPVADKHSWNAPHWGSSAMLLNATRHSDHHAHPGRGYAELAYAPATPTLPRPLPLMASIALIPPLWRRMMDRRVDRWRDA